MQTKELGVSPLVSMKIRIRIGRAGQLGALAVLICLAVATSANAQSLAVVGTLPAEGEASVALESTVWFDFNTALDTTYRFPSGLPVELFAVSPPDSIVIDSVYFSTDLTRVLFDVRHTVDTDFLWILSGARAVSDTVLCAPGIINYSTSPARGPWRVAGTASSVALVKRRACGQFGALTALLYNALPSQGGHPLFGSAVDIDGDYTFTIAGVRDGGYWPAVIADINENGVIQSHASRLPELALYDADGSGNPDGIAVSGADVGDIEMMILVALSTEKELPNTNFSVMANYPNPVIRSTAIPFRSDVPGIVRIEVFDLLGKKVYDSTPQFFAGGQNQATISLAHLADGVYFYRLSQGMRSDARPLVVRSAK